MNTTALYYTGDKIVINYKTAPYSGGMKFWTHAHDVDSSDIDPDTLCEGGSWPGDEQ